MKEALFYEKLDDKKVRCFACNHKCLIENQKLGICAVRKNNEGRLYALTYGKIISESIDPIEKKPLYHFLPNTRTYSICSVGCNFSCYWCQNFEISQISKEGMIIGNKRSPRDIVKKAKEFGCPSISYTYTEPSTWPEFIYETSKIAKKNAIKNIWVTNGYFSKESLDFFSKKGLIDAMNIDLKSFKEKTYMKFCKAKLKPVLESIKNVYEKKIHIEITTLIIPQINDSDKEIKKIAKFIFSIDKKGEIPWHISRFFPRYKMTNIAPTSLETLKKAREIGKLQGLKYIYIGNI